MARYKNVLYIFFFHKSGTYIKRSALGKQAKRDFKRFLDQPPGNCRSSVRLHQVSQAFIQSDVEIPQGWILHNLLGSYSGQSIPLGMGKKVLLISSVNHFIQIYALCLRYFSHTLL